MPAVRNDGTAIVEELFERLTSEWQVVPIFAIVSPPRVSGKTGKLETSEKYSVTS